MATTEPLVDALAAAGYRLTEPRRVVAELVTERDGHFTASDIMALAQERELGIGRATIFRALDLFTELQLLERIDLPNGDHAYVPCLPGYHHHHVICQRCARVTEVDGIPWYRAGAEWLCDRQDEDGGWGGEQEEHVLGGILTGKEIDTAFALLFLLRTSESYAPVTPRPVDFAMVVGFSPSAMVYVVAATSKLSSRMRSTTFPNR